MKKKYTLLNSTIEVEGPKDLIDFIDYDLIEFPLYTKNVREYKVSYKFDPVLYDELIKDLQKLKGEKIRFFGEEYKTKYENDGILFLMDQDSVIVKTNGKFMIIGKKDFSKNHVIYLIREAIYEGFLLDNDLMIHSAAFATNHEGNVLVGAPGAGKTTMLMECLTGIPSLYVSNDIVGVHNNKAEASIIPVRVAYGTLSKYTHQQYDDLSEKETYLLNDFLKEYSLKTDSNVRIKNLVFPHFGLNNHFEISKMNKNEARDLLTSQTLNYGDPVRPYLWVNGFDIRDVKKKTIESKLGNLLGSTESFHIEYGPSMNQEDIKVMKKVMHL